VEKNYMNSFALKLYKVPFCQSTYTRNQYFNLN